MAVGVQRELSSLPMVLFAYFGFAYVVRPKVASWLGDVIFVFIFGPTLLLLAYAVGRVGGGEKTQAFKRLMVWCISAMYFGYLVGIAFRMMVPASAP